jgi:sugar lactone lactonase YvrE
MRTVLAATAAMILTSGCAHVGENTLDALPSWTFADAEVFPAARGLSRSEDGFALADGTIVVVDQAHGMVAIAPDQSMRPFGRFADAGYAHAPERPGGPNGVALEPDGVHALIADIYTGAIYRLDIETEAVERIYEHPYGLNVAVRDSTGAIWFTQSTENAPGPDTEARIFETMNSYAADGVLYRIPPAPPGGALPAPEVAADGLLFANGIVVDEARGRLYLNELTANRVVSWRLDVATGAVSDRRVLIEVPTPDNIEMDADGLLWVGSPLGGRMMVVDPDTGASHPIFWNRTEANDRIVAALLPRMAAQEPALELISPDAWAPLPGGITGVIFAPDGRTVYLTGLGDALLKLER